MIVAGVCMVAAVVFFFQKMIEVAFFIATVGVLAWFLNYRVQMKELIANDDYEPEEDEDSFNSDEHS